ncbi:MAG: tetratricopeptide repeat protein [Minwuia sp.]|nr:tetratricopeptide repeat protein [Minwuia sp.]
MELAARQARIEAKLDALAEGDAPSPEQQERRKDAVRDLVADPDPEASAAVEELTSENGNVENAVARLEQDARNATAEGAAKWRRIGDLVAGFDTARALHAYEEAHHLQPDDFWMAVLLARQRRIAGDLVGALDLLPTIRRAASSGREMFIADTESGQLHLVSGNIGVARAALERSLELLEQLAASNPGSAEAQRDLSVSLERLGDVEVQAGDLAAARAAHERSLEVREQLAASNPGSAQAQRDLSVSLERLGDLEERARDILRAVELYERSLPIAEALATSNPSHPGLQRDLEITQRRLAALRGKLE